MEHAKNDALLVARSSWLPQTFFLSCSLRFMEMTPMFACNFAPYLPTKIKENMNVTKALIISSYVLLTS